MTERQEWKIERLEREVSDLKIDLQKIKDERNQLLGMGSMAKWMVKIIVVLAGWGVFRFISDILHWLKLPMAAR
jgi:hypothetical protein